MRVVRAAARRGEERSLQVHAGEHAVVHQPGQRRRAARHGVHVLVDESRQHPPTPQLDGLLTAPGRGVGAGSQLRDATGVQP
ncbi:MAG TPA: hypothetical protein VGJ95_01875 [Pseudonocardiaceae bacterium]|jgi:hypothetical protein